GTRVTGRLVGLSHRLCRPGHRFARHVRRLYPPSSLFCAPIWTRVHADLWEPGSACPTLCTTPCSMLWGLVPPPCDAGVIRCPGTARPLAGAPVGIRTGHGMTTSLQLAGSNVPRRDLHVRRRGSQCVNRPPSV